MDFETAARLRDELFDLTEIPER
ncbi:MAG: hypothetical protein ACLU5K_07280 [Christensenellales bacterium]